MDKVGPLKDINVKHVVIVAIVFGAIVIVSLAGGDVATVVVVGMAVLAGIGLVAVQQASTQKETQTIREQTNGAQTATLAMIEAQRVEAAAVNRQLLATLEGFTRLLAASNVPPHALEQLPAVIAPTSPAAPPMLDGPPGGYPTQFPNTRDRAA